MEVSGAKDAGVDALFQQLTADLGLLGAEYRLVNVTYLPGSGGRIQLRDTFTVVVTYPVSFSIAPLSGERLPPSIFTIEARLPGMSEVFWR